MTKKNPPESKSSLPTDEDSQLFRETVGDVDRLHHRKTDSEKDKPAPIAKKTNEDQQQVLKDMLSDEYEPVEANASDYLFFSRPGLQTKVLRKLKRGQFSVLAELDMHGMTVNIAREQLIKFLTDCINDNLKCVRIIHGKGRRSESKGAILKDKVNHWLPQRDEVLAFCSAIPAHGGTGAVYVLLKKAKRGL